ncbi:nitrous oxide reductase accessory protein NosL [Enhydrobacter sp.]|jgi:copper chaperone NosL|uniref:nitrous oxide reductase accessory protein NosL n=1 Tax=Enhydrobacter sp. TaxID=1894999 RepID=UPI00262F4AAD|nr:nitrous oxide reductase accessory protein NosL [Enhydrobacter sp.]
MAALLALVLAGLTPSCDEKSANVPLPHEVTGESTAQFCGMTLAEHPGPKGQIFIKSDPRPFWFASVRDAFAFVMLEDTPKAVVAIYVNDMGKAKNWDQPESGTWVEARKAVYVIGSRKHGGMGQDEAVPFSDRQLAERFVDNNGGRVVTFDDMPRDYILPSGNAATTEPLR